MLSLRMISYFFAVQGMMETMKMFLQSMPVFWA